MCYYYYSKWYLLTSIILGDRKDISKQKTLKALGHAS